MRHQGRPCLTTTRANPSHFTMPMSFSRPTSPLRYFDPKTPTHLTPRPRNHPSPTRRADNSSNPRTPPTTETPPGPVSLRTAPATRRTSVLWTGQLSTQHSSHASPRNLHLSNFPSKTICQPCPLTRSCPPPQRRIPLRLKNPDCPHASAPPGKPLQLNRRPTLLMPL